MTLCVASGVFIVVVNFIIDSVQKLLISPHIIKYNMYQLLFGLYDI